MITEYELPTIIKTELPALCEKVYPERMSLRSFTCMHYFSDYTRHAIEAHNYPLAKRCFLLADDLYQHGDKIVKLLVKNIFVYSFSAMMPADKTELNLLKAMIPQGLYDVYVKQIAASGI